MADWSPKDLDKLFQDGSEQHGFDYNPDAWDQMETLLNKDKKRRFFWWFFSAIGLLSVIILVWMNIEIAPMPNSTISNGNIKQENPTFQQGNTTKNAKIKEKQVVVPNQSNPPSNGSFNSKENSKPVTNSNIAKITTFEKKEVTTSNIETNDINNNGNETNSKREKIQNEWSNHTQGYDEKNKQETFTILKMNQLIGLPIKPIEYQEVEPHQWTPITIKHNNNHFFVGIVVGADGSSVTFNDFSKINWEIGIQAGYRFRRKFATTIGLTYTQQSYQAKKGDYIPPVGFWTRKIAPESTQAECNILEIPISVGYFHNGYKNNGIYTNLGFTSYFMLKERYNYFYDLPDADLRKKWGTENENFHLFSMAQIGFGYQFISPTKSIFQIEPYAQIPLTGIGHGQVKLYSFGLNLKYIFR